MLSKQANLAIQQKLKVQDQFRSLSNFQKIYGECYQPLFKLNDILVYYYTSFKAYAANLMIKIEVALCPHFFPFYICINRICQSEC